MNLLILRNVHVRQVNTIPFGYTHLNKIHLICIITTVSNGIINMIKFTLKGNKTLICFIQKRIQIMIEGIPQPLIEA